METIVPCKSHKNEMLGPLQIFMIATSFKWNHHMVFHNFH